MAADPRRGRRISFLAKVLIPVLAFLILLPLFTLWTVTRQMSRQVLEDARQRLETADGVFAHSLSIRSRNLLTRYQSVVNEPRFKAVASLADPRTMTVHLNTLLTEISGDAEIMLFHLSDAELLAGARRPLNLDLVLFAEAAAAAVSQALNGQPSVTTIAFGDSIFNLISAPVTINEQVVGALTVGEHLGDKVMRELKLLARTDILILSGNAIVASTLEDRNLHRILLDEFAGESSDAQAVPRDPMRPVILRGEHFLTSAGFIPAAVGGKIQFLLLSSYENQLREFEQARAALLWFSGLGIAASAGAVWLLIRRVTQPLREITAHAEAVGQGDFSRRIERSANDECGDLADSFNRMTLNLRASRAELEKTVERLHATQSQLVQSEKLSAVGQFVAGVTHELNNPLTSIIGFSELLQNSDLSETNRKYVDHLARNTERCHKIVQSLLSFSRQQAAERKPVNINELIDGVLEIVTYDFRTNNVTVLRNLSSNLPRVLADPHQLQQIFLNILTNARQAMEANPDERKIEIATSAGPEGVHIIFQDNGPGISRESLPRIFDPFFTTKPIGKGTGLGLSLSYGIIQEHGGRIYAKSEPGAGAAFHIELPPDRSSPSAAASSLSAADMATAPILPAADAHGNSNGNGQQVLVIDDEESILTLIRAILEGDGYRVESTSNGAAALRQLTEVHYDLVVCDWKMPGLNGIEIFKTAAEANPEITRRFVFMTGDVIAENFKDFLKQHSLPCLPKPFSIQEFHYIVGGLS